jgi:hypothetical protein
MWRRVKPEQARSDGRGRRDEKNPIHYVEVTPSLVGADKKTTRNSPYKIETRARE